MESYYTNQHRKLTEQFNNMFQYVKQFIIEEYGIAISFKLARASEKYFEESIHLIPYIGGKKNPNTIFLIMITWFASFIKAMRDEGKTIVEAVTLIYLACDHYFQIIPKWKKALIKRYVFSYIFIQKLKKTAKTSQNSPYPEDWKFRVIENEDGCDWGIEFSTCGIHQFAQKLDIENYLPYCNFFDVIYSRHLDMGLETTSTFDQGVSRCRMLFKKGRKTIIPVNSQQIAQEVSIRKVRKLPLYGKPIRGFDKKIEITVMLGLVKILIKKFNLIRSIFILIRAKLGVSTLIKKYPEAYEKSRKYAGKQAKDHFLLASLFNTVNGIYKNREKTYDEIFKELMRDMGDLSLGALYCIDELANLEDPYSAFKEFNVGMFLPDYHFPSGPFHDEGDHFYFDVLSCVQTEYAKLVGVPEIGRIGCDHDCFGYPKLSERGIFVFNRPETIAKGGQCCRFNFYRKGTQPEDLPENK